ncbi:sugar ABC transporter ATP-binding protein [Sphaerisporangium melleum]|uniref:Sugar ABC transporter ATP-binding protein n=1 Tax=Sphaerisporangium melleum TaxID=321316 RepID=A0A917RPQ7_9ACTN|nr:sugar ABC transporter ATP-binding protein [Sphaerisporangium melleum]GGL18628.1 sugar ABC transporter ATP-binding protein [Sphaerisporangium melleum]GII74806.1 sugar ABC transporter ATP-binding protein [Sphaerisporangium melleum]
MSDLLVMRGIVKQFPGVRALDGVDLDVRAGEVHCLLGQNGAGKSTLIKILAGAHRPDEGTVTFGGEPVSFSGPMAAIRSGISTIYQELDLVDGLSVAENVFLGHEQAAYGFTRRRDMNRAAAALLARLGHGEMRPTTEVGRLPAAGKQIVSMARALSHQARLIVMDEPSAALAHDEVTNLFRVIRDLTAQGVAVVYISHRLEEIREIGDRVTVLKDGRTAAVGLPARETPTSTVVSLMTGRDVEYVFPPRPAPGTHDGRPEVLRVEGLTLPGGFADVSFAVREGEIVGLAGLVGSGRSEIVETVYGARRPAAGRVVLAGRPVRPGSTRRAVRLGMGLAPEERKSQALLMNETVARNITIAGLSKYSWFGWMNRKDESAEAARLVKAVDIRPPDPARPVRTLSGGNQQKAVLARWLVEDRKLLLLDEPTRGVDVGARAELYAVIRRLADEGVGVLLVSSEVPEVLGLADRVLVLREGKVIHESDARDLDEPRVLDMIMEGSAL